MCADLLPDFRKEPTPYQLTFKATPAHPELVIQIEVAASPLSRAKGLMNRTTLEPNHGMLFVFPEAQILTFWMKDTLIPLDIIFISENHEITSIVENATPCIQPECTVYKSIEVSLYVVEVNAGFVTRNQIKKGHKVHFNPYSSE